MSERIVQRCGDARLEILPHDGGRLGSLQIDGVELLRTGGPTPLEWGSYPMAPWTGRMRESRFTFRGVEYTMPSSYGAHALHGTVLDRAWNVVDDFTIETELGDPWPFAGWARQVIRLGIARLDQRLEIHAHEAAMPACAGWHPWFLRQLDRGESGHISFDAGWMERRDQEGISLDERVPVPPGPWDDAFGDVQWPARIEWPGFLTLEVDSTLPYLVVYNEREIGFCVEPTTAPPDAINRGQAQIVEPGVPLIAECTWRWTSSAAV